MNNGVLNFVLNIACNVNQPNDDRKSKFEIIFFSFLIKY